MGRPGKKKVRFKRIQNLDIISDLPQDVKENILIRLPIKDAVGTSILSSKWRYAWTFIPDLVLGDHDCFYSSDNSQEICRLVDCVLSLHDGPIRKFGLTSNERCHADLDRWMRILSRNKISELVLELNSREEYKIPTSLFTWHALKYISLANFNIYLPRKFTGFELLHTIKLRDCTFSKGDLGYLISSCPQLETLVLEAVKGITTLNIQTPSLRRLHISSYFNKLYLQAPHLVTVSIDKKDDPVDPFSSGMHHCGSHLIQGLGCLSSLEKIKLRGSSMVYLSCESLLEELPAKFGHLKDMVLEICFSDAIEAAATLCLFQSAPMLENLTIWNRDPLSFIESESATAWNEMTISRCAFNRLRSLNIIYFLGLEPELAFLELLLAAAPVLEGVKLVFWNPSGETIEAEILMKLLKFRRASSKAEITII